MDIKEAIRKGDLKTAKPSPDEIAKEINEAEKDLKDAEYSINEGKWKWAIIQSYYAMFHAARAVLLKSGYKERAHYAFVVVLEHLKKNKKLESYFVDDFKAAKFAREEADYESNYSRERAQQILTTAEEFVARMIKLI